MMRVLLGIALASGTVISGLTMVHDILKAVHSPTRPLLLAAISILAIACSTQSRITLFPEDDPVGFSNLMITPQAANGKTVELCKKGRAWVGFISQHTGSVADPAVARLEDLQMSESTGKFTFTARLFAGMAFDSGLTNGVPAFSEIQFSGQIGEDGVLGVFKTQTTDPISGKVSKPSSDSVVMARVRKSSDNSPPGANCSEWSEFWAQRLKFLTRRYP